ncbi:MAG: putative collagen-binding domain-containing protein [Roseiflexaceae bacterium]
MYSAAGEPFTVDLGKLSGHTLVGSWHDPRTGTVHAIGSIPAGGAHTFRPPTRGSDSDWVLALDAEG